jgi:hypothetical protein
LAPKGEPCFHSRQKTKEVPSNCAGGINPDWDVAGFKKCCISNALDGIEDDFVWQNVEDESDKRVKRKKEKVMVRSKVRMRTLK